MAKIIADINLFITEIKGLLEQKKWSELRKSLSELPAPDIAMLLLKIEKAGRGNTAPAEYAESRGY